MLAPFSLIGTNGCFDFPKYLPRDAADGGTQGIGRRLGIEIKDALEIRVGKEGVGVVGASGIESIANAVGCGHPEAISHGSAIILRKIAIRKDADQLRRIALPIVPGKNLRNLRELHQQPIGTGNPKGALQSGHNRDMKFIPHFPLGQRAGIPANTGV